MGTKVHCKSYLPGYYSMRDLNEDSSSSSWPLFCGDKTVTNGQYFNGFMPRTTIDCYPGYDKDALKQKMLEHETVFRNQVYELHRLYRIQRDMMEEVKTKELHKQRASIEPSSSSSLQGSQMPSEDARKWHMAGFPLSNSGYGRTSILGVEIVKSPMSCTNGNNTQPSQFPFQNGSTSKDCETLDSRPLKVRKKLFDLQLPAEEYVDTEGENLQEYKVSELSSYALDKNSKTAAESSTKLILESHAGVKVDCPMDASASGSCFRGSIVADLNEPIQIEESTAPSPFEFHSHTSTNGETKWMNQSAKSNARYLGVIHDGFFMNSSVESKANERGRLSHIYEAGSSNNLSSTSQGLRQGKLPMPSVQGMPNQVHHPPGIYSTVCSREDLWRDGPCGGIEFSDRNCDHHNSHLEPLVTSQSPGSYPFFSSPCFTSSWAHSVSSWAKPKSSFIQKLTTFESPFNSTAAVDRSLQPSAQSQEVFGGKWQVNVSSRLNPGLGSEGTKVNGFFHGPASGPKELQVHLPSAGFDYLNCSRGDKLVSDRSTNQGFGIFSKGSCHGDSKPVVDINLNEVVSSSSNEPVILEDLNTIDEKSKPEDPPPTLPWLRPKPACGNEGDLSYLQASSNQFCCNRETVRDLNQPFTPKVVLASSDCEIMGKKEAAETQNVKKILGFPIFETVAPKNEPSSLVSTSTIVDCLPEEKNVNNERKNRIIDINLECEPDEQIANEVLTLEKQKKGACFIDLNSSVSDCEDPPAPSFERKSNGVKVTLEIDLEAPVFLESEDDDMPSKENLSDVVSFQSLENKAEPIQDEILRNAADTMVAISSSCPQIHKRDSICHPSEASLADSLLWFVNAVSSCAVELDHKSGKESRARDGSPQQDFSEEIDEFEAMMLQLEETKEEDYMPKPFVPEGQIEEDAGANSLATRSRRGQSRRGRQRRDFQRDILPGLTSLSRHEVTEDLQTFGGLMRATGHHHWNSGLTRRNGTRNGGARGRRRAVVESVSTAIPTTVCSPLMQQLNNIEAGLEDRSLTGWGKTTRRPRRQRFPAGNPPTVALT